MMLSSPRSEGVHIKPVSVHDIETLSDDKAACRLKHLLKVNHHNHSILYNNHRFHNHTPHFLGSVYLLGGSAQNLDSVYGDAVDRDILESWKPSPSSITLNNYRAHLTKGDYQRAWADFFQDQMQTVDKWQNVVTRFLLDAGPKDDVNSAPMLYCLTAGLGHPLIHLGYAFELNSREVAIEALSLLATCYDPQLISLHTRPCVQNSTSEPTYDLFEIFSRVRSDKSIPIFRHPGDQNLMGILEDQAQLDAVMSYLDSLRFDNLTSQFLQAYRLASTLLISTSPQLGGHGYDFFLVHLLTTAQAIRNLLPNLPAQNHVMLIREWFLMALLMYVAQNRPKLDLAHVSEFELQNRGWEFVRQQAIEGKHATDAHFVKACRAMNAGAETWGDNDQWFLRCAVRFVSEFEEWRGFMTDGEGAEEARLNRIRDGIHV